MLSDLSTLVGLLAVGVTLIDHSQDAFALVGALGTAPIRVGDGWSVPSNIM